MPDVRCSEFYAATILGAREDELPSRRGEGDTVEVWPEEESAVVPAASAGLGIPLATALAREGAFVMCGRDRARTEGAGVGIVGSATSLIADVSTPAAASEVVELASRHLPVRQVYRDRLRNDGAAVPTGRLEMPGEFGKLVPLLRSEAREVHHRNCDPGDGGLSAGLQ